MGLDLILYWKSVNAERFFGEFENVFMCLMAFFLLLKKAVLCKVYFKSLVFLKQNAVVLRFKIVSDTNFYRLDLVASFSN